MNGRDKIMDANDEEVPASPEVVQKSRLSFCRKKRKRLLRLKETTRSQALSTIDLTNVPDLEQLMNVVHSKSAIPPVTVIDSEEPSVNLIQGKVNEWTVYSFDENSESEIDQNEMTGILDIHVVATLLVKANQDVPEKETTSEKDNLLFQLSKNKGFGLVSLHEILNKEERKKEKKNETDSTKLTSNRFQITENTPLKGAEIKSAHEDFTDTPTIIIDPLKPNSRFESQFFQETDTQISHACELTDAAARNIFEINKETTSTFNQSGPHDPNIIIETQTFDVTDSQIISACAIADVAECVLLKGRHEMSPEHTQTVPSTSISIVESILNDFSVSPSELTPEIVRTPSPPVKFQGDARHNYTKRKLVKQLKKTPRKLNLNYMESDSGSESDHEKYVNTVRELDDLLVEEDNEIEIDLNSSRNIIDNIANLSTHFTQSSQDGSYADAPVDQVITEKNSQNNCTDKSHDDDNAAHDVGLFGMISYDDNLFNDLPEIREHAESLTNVKIKPSAGASVNVEKSLLDVDEDLFLNLNVSKINVPMVNPVFLSGTSTPILKPIRTRNPSECDRTEFSLEPHRKRMRFETSENGFDTRHRNGSHSNIEDAIKADTQWPKALNAGIVSATKSEYKSRTPELADNTNDKGFRRKDIADMIPSTYQSNASYQPKFEGFKTARGSSILVSDEGIKKFTSMFNSNDLNAGHSTSKAKLKMERLFESIDEETVECNQSLSLTAAPQILNTAEKLKNIRQSGSSAISSCSKPITTAIASFKNEVNSNAMKVGFCTARGSTISVSANTKTKMERLFEGIDEETVECYQSLSQTAAPQTLNTAEKFKNIHQSGSSAISICSKPITTAIASFKNEVNSNAMKVGFCTARGSTISVSANTKTKMERLFEGIDEETVECHQSLSQTAAPQTLNTAEKLKNIRQSGLSAINSCSKPITNVIASFENKVNSNAMKVGFCTARGSTISVSANAKTKMDRFFEGIDEETKESCQNTYPLAMATSATLTKVKTFKDVHRCGSSTSSSRSIQSTSAISSFENKENSNAVKVGFCTARGSTISVSASTKSKMDQFFEGIDEEIKESNESSTLPVINAPHTVIKRTALKSIHQRNSALPNNQTERQVSLTESDSLRSEILLKDFEGEINNGHGSLSPVVSKFTYDKKTLSISNDCLHTPINAKFPSDFKTSTPHDRLSNLAENGKMACVTPRTMERLESAEDSVRFLQQFDKIGLDDIFDDLVNTSQCVAERRLPKKTCLASKFKDIDEEENLAATISNNIEEKRIGPPEMVPDSVKHDRRLALLEQQRSNKNKSESVKPLPGSLLLTKLISSRQQLSTYGCPQIATTSELKELGMTESVLNFIPSNFDAFEFRMWEFYPLEICLNNVHGILLSDKMSLIMNDRCTVGLAEIASCLLSCPNVVPRLIPDNWISNCLKWIVWKLAGLERSFPRELAGKACTPANLLLQMKYRYDREIDRAERPALRRIVERDDTPAKRMVLFVSDIQKTETNGLDYCLQLSDGWYSIWACIDRVLMHAVTTKKIVIGTKLVIQGAELIGSEEACSPLENNNSVQLKITANSTRRARWDVKLGFCQRSSPFILNLNSLHENGGLICRIDVYILRVYPSLYMVKIDDGENKRTTFRSEKVERRIKSLEDRKRLELIEKLYGQISQQVDSDFEKKQKLIRTPKKKVKDIEDGKELWELLQYTNDPDGIEVQLTSPQRDLVKDYNAKLYEKRNDEIHRLVTEKLEEQSSQSNVTHMLKARVMDAKCPSSKSAMITIWNPNDSIMLREKQCIRLNNVSASGLRSGELQLSTSRRTLFKEITYPVNDVHLQMNRSVTSISTIDVKSFRPVFNEFDTVGFVVAIDPINEQRFQTVHIANATKNLLSVNFWVGIKEFAYDDVILCGHLLVIQNLEWRPMHQMKRSKIPQAFVSEFTIFTEKPQSSCLKLSFETMQKDFQTIENIDNFMDECRELIELSAINQDTSINRSTISTPNRISASTSIGLHASSITKNVQPVSAVREKITKLENYSLTSPISPIILKPGIGRRSLRSNFKSPLSSHYYNQK